MFSYILAILGFGLLVLGHEFGHYITARIFGVTVYEFSIGMGPKIFSKKSQKTGILYSLRWIPIGGYVSMAGEDEESNDENALNKKAVWKRMIILVAGGVMNLIMGLIIMFIYVTSSPAIGSNTVAEFGEGAISNVVLKEGDRIVSVNGAKTSISSSLLYEIMWGGGKDESFEWTDEKGEVNTVENVSVMDLTVIRDGKKLNLKVPFLNEEYEGVNFGTTDFKVYREKKTFFSVVKHAFSESVLAGKQVWESLVGLITGRFSIKHLSGPVGVANTVSDSVKLGAASFFYVLGLISVNLGIMNLLPFPALDGGRLVFQFIELIFRKPVRRDIEAKIHATGLVLLFALIAVVTLKDVINLF